MLTVTDLTCRFGPRTAVDKACFTLDRPVFLGIIGRSGAGKSTFLRMMNRLTDASSGEIRVDGTRYPVAERLAPDAPGKASAP